MDRLTMRNSDGSVSQPTTTTFEKAMYRLADYEDAIQRLGKFGELFVDYRGCPRGPMGRSAKPLEDEVLFMPVITDVDGGPWIPVNADALHELVGQYKALRAQAEAERNEPLTPCDLCIHNPPSSHDGKPCSMCPAAAKNKQEEEEHKQ